MNDTEENDAFRIDHVRGTKNVRRRSKQRRINHKKTTRKKHTRFQNGETQTEKRTSISAFKTNDANRIKAEDLKKNKNSSIFLIREIKLLHGKNVHH